MNLFTRTLSKIFKSSNQQELDKIRNLILAINNKETEIQSLSFRDLVSFSLLLIASIKFWIPSNSC